MKPLTIHTFGDSVLDCARYNEARVHPAALLIRNNDRIYPEWRGRDLFHTKERPLFLDHRATDGATAEDLFAQTSQMHIADDEDHIAIISVGGNDLLTYMGHNSKWAWGNALWTFRHYLVSFVDLIAGRMPTFVLNVYDPSMGNDENNILGVEPYMLEEVAKEMRKRHVAVNAEIAGACVANRAHYVDLHKHFLDNGDETWFTNVIEPSLIGASEVRAVLWPRVARAAGIMVNNKAVYS